MATVTAEAKMQREIILVALAGARFNLSSDELSLRSHANLSSNGVPIHLLTISDQFHF
jgi:hypothetical protein